MAGNTSLALQYPVGSSNEALRAAVVRLVDVLRTIQTDADQQAAIDALNVAASGLQSSFADLNTLFAGLDGTVLDLTSGLATARTDLDGALVELSSITTTITEIQSDVGANAASITVEAGARATADSALAGQITTVSAATGQNTAALNDEIVARTNADAALAGQITTVSAAVAGNTAAITDEAVARANADGAISATVNTVSTTVGDHTAQIQSVSSSIDGISARWGVSVNLDGAVTGLVRLDGGQSGSTFTVVADKFIFANPTASGDVKPLFGAGNINGVPTFGVLGNAIIDGTILARHITVDTLSAISADLGTVTAGILRSPADETYWNLVTGEFRSKYYSDLYSQMYGDLTAADVALNQAVTTVLNSVGVLETDVAALQSNELTAQERFEIALDHAIDTVQGSRREWQRYVEEQMAHIVDFAATLRRLTNDNSASIINEQIVRNSETSSLAATISAVAADLANTDAAVANVQIAYAAGDAALQTDIDGAVSDLVSLTSTVATNTAGIGTLNTSVGALAADITAVETTANGNTASITTLTASIDGIYAQWGVAVNQNGRIVGSITLDGLQNVSTVGILADRFVIVHPTADGTTINPFSVGLVNGVWTVGINGARVIEGTVLARHIAANQIDASKINVATLAAISANLGTITAGLIRNATDTIRFDLPNMRIYRTDGTMDIDWANKTIDITF